MKGKQLTAALAAERQKSSAQRKKDRKRLRTLSSHRCTWEDIGCGRLRCRACGRELRILRLEDIVAIP